MSTSLTLRWEVATTVYKNPQKEEETPTKKINPHLFLCEEESNLRSPDYSYNIIAVQLEAQYINYSYNKNTNYILGK